MSDLKTQFKKAQDEVNGLPNRPDNSTLLRLYGLYKQATVGDAGDDAPGALDFVRRAKYDAWDELRGISAEDAMEQYIRVAGTIAR